MIRFSNVSGSATEQLRPTHARLVMERLGGAPVGSSLGFRVTSRELARAAAEVRDGYRCRTVRKELRRVIMLCSEDGGQIIVRCDDEATLADMLAATRH